MFDAGTAAPHETASDASGSREGKTATTLPALSPRAKPAKRKRRTIADVRRAATAVSAQADGLSVFDDRRIAVDGAERRQRAARFAARSYDPMPVIKPRNSRSRAPRSCNDLLTERHGDALADLADYAERSALVARVDRARRQGKPPSQRDSAVIAAAMAGDGVTRSERPMIRWTSHTAPFWLSLMFRDMREIPTRHGRILKNDPRPQFLLWFYGGATEFQIIVARHAARAALYFAHVAFWDVSNKAVVWAVHDAIERVVHGPAAIRQRMLRQSASQSGDRPYETDADRAAFVGMNQAQFVRLRNVAERSIWKALQNSLLAFMEVCGNSPSTENVIMSMSSKTLAKG